MAIKCYACDLGENKIKHSAYNLGENKIIKQWLCIKCSIKVQPEINTICHHLMFSTQSMQETSIQKTFQDIFFMEQEPHKHVQNVSIYSWCFQELTIWTLGYTPTSAPWPWDPLNNFPLLWKMFIFHWLVALQTHWVILVDGQARKPASWLLKPLNWAVI